MVGNHKINNGKTLEDIIKLLDKIDKLKPVEVPPNQPPLF